MSFVCLEQHHSHPIYSTKKTVRDIDIPPRKLLSRRPKTLFSFDDASSPLKDPSDRSLQDEPFFQKFLPYNGGDDYESDPYSRDDFRMYEFKVRRCMRSRSHDWTDCPFAHPGEKARRRDPRRFHYSGNVCTNFRRGECRRGDACEFAHGVFECWLHPARYRTQVCKDGKNCKRKVCFFAHTPRQLRVLPSHSQTQTSPPASSVVSSNHCCVFCNSIASSPTYTLMGLSHFSPPLSPDSPPISPLFSHVNGRSNDKSKSAYSPFSRYNELSATGNQILPEVLNYRDALAELVCSLEDLDLNGASPTPISNGDLSWVDVSFQSEDQQQFILSPSTPQATYGFKDCFKEDGQTDSFMDEKINNNGWACPDLEWVNELVM